MLQEDLLYNIFNHIMTIHLITVYSRVIIGLSDSTGVRIMLRIRHTKVIIMNKINVLTCDKNIELLKLGKSKLVNYNNQ